MFYGVSCLTLLTIFQDLQLCSLTRVSEMPGFSLLPSVLQLGYHCLYHHRSADCLWSTRGEKDILPHWWFRSEPGKQPVGAAAIQREEHCYQSLGKKNQVDVLLYCAGRWPSSGFYKYSRALPCLLLSKMKSFLVFFFLTNPEFPDVAKCVTVCSWRSLLEIRFWIC